MRSSGTLEMKSKRRVNSFTRVLGAVIFVFTHTDCLSGLNTSREPAAFKSFQQQLRFSMFDHNTSNIIARICYLDLSALSVVQYNRYSVFV